MQQKELNGLLGNVDIYLLDHILKGHFDNKIQLLDAGCGEGRNLKYFVDNGYAVHGIDLNPMAIKMAKMMYKSVSENFAVANLTDLPYPETQFDAVICTAVLHFAKDQKEFEKMLSELVRVLKDDGVMFIRMATDIGLVENKNSFPYLLQTDHIETTFAKQGLKLTEPWKSVVVEGKRSMGSFMLKK